jgi:hypothetical protein
VFGIPNTITRVEMGSVSGYTCPELPNVFPGQPLLKRTSMNSWDDQKMFRGANARSYRSVNLGRHS